MTRCFGVEPSARRKLLIIGDSATLGTHPFYSRLLEYCEVVGGDCDSASGIPS
jgi:superfamily I DNA and/or RNA helicase